VKVENTTQKNKGKRMKTILLPLILRIERSALSWLPCPRTLCKRERNQFNEQDV
jgi:hypothetical protein